MFIPIVLQPQTDAGSCQFSNLTGYQPSPDVPPANDGETLTSHSKKADIPCRTRVASHSHLPRSMGFLAPPTNKQPASPALCNAGVTGVRKEKIEM